MVEKDRGEAGGAERHEEEEGGLSSGPSSSLAAMILPPARVDIAAGGQAARRRGRPLRRGKGLSHDGAYDGETRQPASPLKPLSTLHLSWISRGRNVRRPLVGL